MKRKKLSEPTIERLCRIYTLAEKMSREGIMSVTSKVMEKKTGIPSHTIRKDLSMIGTAGSTRSGYAMASLKNLISTALLFNVPRKACIAGLSMPGLSMLDNPETRDFGFEVLAGFDSSINRIEMVETSIPLFPSYEITEKVREMGIEIAVLAVPPYSAEKTAASLIEGGVTGIINFSPVILSFEKRGIIVKNIYLPEELRILSALITAGGK